MGYVSLIADCGQCGRPFMSNMNGRQLVFCRDCVEAATPERVRRGLALIVVHPLAYEPAEA
jgi:hypothetical protein